MPAVFEYGATGLSNEPYDRSFHLNARRPSGVALAMPTKSKRTNDPDFLHLLHEPTSHAHQKVIPLAA
jgi:hypothetical protein